MASTAAKAIRKQNATERLTTVAGDIALRLGLDPPTVGKRSQDPELAHVQDLEAVADFLESIAGKLTLPKKGVRDGEKEKGR